MQILVITAIGSTTGQITVIEETNSSTISIRYNAKVAGTNSNANTFQIDNYILLNRSDGLIPKSRISSNISSIRDISCTPDIDNKSITINTNDGLHIVDVINQNNTTTAIKTWTCIQRTFSI